MRPTAGIAPIVLAAALLQLPIALANLGVAIPAEWIMTPGQRSYASPFVVLSILLAGGLSLWFQPRPSDATSERLEAWKRTVFESIVGVAALGLLGIFLEKVAVTLALVQLVAHATAVILDMRDEAAARAAHGELQPIGQWSTLATLDALIKKMYAAEIVVFPRGLQTRKLYYVFAPHIQVDLLVPVKDVERATELLAKEAA
jgi:hypothetical protein